MTYLPSLQVAVYGARLAGALLLMELITHTLYFNAIARFGLPRGMGAAAGGAASALEAGMTGFWVLAFMCDLDPHSRPPLLDPATASGVQLCRVPI